MKVIWTKRASKSLENIFDYIAKNSEKRAFDVVFEIKEHAENLVIFPEKYQLEDYIDKSKNVRRAVIYNYKILYRVKTDAVYIVNIFHTAQNPKKLKTL